MQGMPVVVSGKCELITEQKDFLWGKHTTSHLFSDY